MAYSAEQRGWYYTEPVWALPAIELTEGDLVAILLTEKLSRQYRGTAIGQQVTQAFSKVLDAMTNTITLDLEALAEAHSFEAAATSELDPKRFAQLGRAVRERRQIKMYYFTASSGDLKWRTVNPLHLRNHLGDWYLIAGDHGRKKPLDFHCGRIRELQMLEDKFDWPSDKKLKGKYDLDWTTVKGTPREKDYRENKEKLARDAFLAIRSRSNKEDFIEYFVSTICSVSQHLNQQAYLKVAEDLFSRTEDIRTLTMLALSARG